MNARQKCWSFLQLAAEKKTPFLAGIYFIFGLSYFVKALVEFLQISFLSKDPKCSKIGFYH